MSKTPVIEKDVARARIIETLNLADYDRAFVQKITGLLYSKAGGFTPAIEDDVKAVKCDETPIGFEDEYAPRIDYFRYDADFLPGDYSIMQIDKRPFIGSVFYIIHLTEKVSGRELSTMAKRFGLDYLRKDPRVRSCVELNPEKFLPVKPAEITPGLYWIKSGPYRKMTHENIKFGRKHIVRDYSGITTNRR